MLKKTSQKTDFKFLSEINLWQNVEKQKNKINKYVNNYPIILDTEKLKAYFGRLDKIDLEDMIILYQHFRKITVNGKKRQQ